MTKGDRLWHIHPDLEKLLARSPQYGKNAYIYCKYNKKSKQKFFPSRATGTFIVFDIIRFVCDVCDFPLLLMVNCFHFAYVSNSQNLYKTRSWLPFSSNTGFYGQIASGDYVGQERIRCRYTQIKRPAKLILTKLQLEKGLHIFCRLPYICNQLSSFPTAKLHFDVTIDVTLDVCVPILYVESIQCLWIPLHD